MKKLLIPALIIFSVFTSLSLKAEENEVKPASAPDANNAAENSLDVEIQTEIPAIENTTEEESLFTEKKPMFSFYVGGGAIIASDATFLPFDVNSVANPLLILDSAGYNVALGFVPLNNVGILRFLRGEVETTYMRSNYSNIQNIEVNADADPLTQVPGRISLKKSLMYNFYIDFKGFSDVFYPYVGYGFGAGNLDIFKVDVSEVGDVPGFELCPSYTEEDGCQGEGLGEDYTAEQQTVVLNQVMLGFAYKVPRLRTSFNIEYRYIHSSSVTVTALNDDIYGTEMDVNYNLHTVTAGIKYFFR